MTAKHKCSAKTPDMQGVPNVHPCARSATVQRDGKWWCWQHDPEHVKAEAIKRMTAWQAEQDRLDTLYIRNTRLVALVTEELAPLLERLAHDAEYVSTLNDPYRYTSMLDADEARKLAARIREILDEH